MTDSLKQFDIYVHECKQASLVLTDDGVVYQSLFEQKLPDNLLHQKCAFHRFEHIRAALIPYISQKFYADRIDIMKYIHDMFFHMLSAGTKTEQYERLQNL